MPGAVESVSAQHLNSLSHVFTLYTCTYHLLHLNICRSQATGLFESTLVFCMINHDSLDIFSGTILI